jgi:hypothetical protein
VVDTACCWTWTLFNFSLGAVREHPAIPTDMNTAGAFGRSACGTKASSGTLAVLSLYLCPNGLRPSPTFFATMADAMMEEGLSAVRAPGGGRHNDICIFA